MTQKAIVAPVLEDLDRVGLTGTRVIIASAFYTPGPLAEIEIDAKRIDLFVRLDLSSLYDWAWGSIAPDALLAFAQQQRDSGCKINIRISASAHAKVYWGPEAFLVGSANLTTRGLGGSDGEILWLESGNSAHDAMRRALDEYANSLTPLAIDDLEDYVGKHQGKIAGLREKLKKARKTLSDESRLPKLPNIRPARLGEYKDFLNWLTQQKNHAAQIILGRAHGDGQLSGHIYRNFYGVRQFLLTHPRWMKTYLATDPTAYSFLGDANAQSAVAKFISNQAADEGDHFSVARWRTYLPASCGGKATSGGATSGNLNRMLPLIARYLTKRIR